MPELPEVQNFAQALQINYVGQSFTEIVFHRENLRYPFEKEKLKKIFANGNVFLKCFREGKQLILETTGGFVQVSLGMTGSFKEANKNEVEKHQHVTLNFKNGQSLAFLDPRRFGFWKVRDSDEPKKIICDPLNQEDLEQLFVSTQINQKSCSVKDMLMDQNLIGGIGNIYALEALFLAGVSPLKNCDQISKIKWRKLSEQIPSLLNKAIEHGGSSISTYRSLNGEKGSFQKLHLVYGRENEKCLKKKCNGVILRVPQSGRSSWYCPLCQN
ncbi:bifunctional DNA-formamidopyrimidine glycosylase/DNA-(apurinic or apyrimidinic site) lyase [Fluviispira multicolorata]|uniref:Formamidopyrimidine-DNA glycosylase n=1 Tax=Fluviispira multicolorata TaxID=2654512 RepID=A0A833N5D6_9BACT|nr:bifunctional DNA-formamidopyrimidine glycosylase/DNA-(apurinic or apyrimidinic site) lyase [Fluviispira multicolorata]KAB8033712.1 bifunctional DNA-formamidopyrimidine glycosylase/DNA-(apurinic or apyrimidinic site) lyase [Fluviispira multicolorata]